MSLGKSREKRANAGSRMHRLLAEEQEDDFYKTTYGGFEEESGDEEYSSEESDAETSSDSDIDAPEDDEVISNSDDDGPKRKRGVDTKSYKEPPKKLAAVKKAPTSSLVPKEKREKSATPVISKGKQRRRAKDDSGSVRKSSRRSTIQRVNEFELRIKERETKARTKQKTRKNVPEMRRLTQEELLAEAKITEKKNLHSLYLFQQLEEQKKKTKVFKKGFTGPFIRYLSTTMPVKPKTQEMEDVNVDRVEQAESGPSSQSKKEKIKSTEKCCRNFITFSDPEMYKDGFPRGRKRPPPKQLCPMTRYPARYVDPVTGIAFATKQAFKIIRETYATEIAAAMSGEQPKHRRSKHSSSSSQEPS